MAPAAATAVDCCVTQRQRGGSRSGGGRTIELVTWKSSARESETGLIGKLAQANIDEVAPVDDEVVVVRDDDPGSAPLRQRLAASTNLRVREVTGLDELAGLVAGGRVRAVVLCRHGLALAALHAAVSAARERAPGVSIVVFDDEGGAARAAAAWHAGADAVAGPQEDAAAVGAAVLGAAERRAEERAVGEALTPRAEAEVLALLDAARPLAALLVRAENLAGLASRYARGDRDTLVLGLAAAIAPLLRPSDLLARTEDDCLLVARRDFDELAIAALADRVVLAGRRPIPVGAESVSLTVAVGIAIGGARESDANRHSRELLASARAALGRAEGRGGSGFELADATLQGRVTAQRRTEVALRHALDNHEFRVFYQPVVELAGGGLVSFEALMRWQRPQAELFDAGSFVGAAQRSGLMARIGQTILREAATEAARWSSPDGAPPSLSVNLSPQEYFMPALVGSVGRILGEAGLPPDRLTVEVPHGLLVHDPLSARSILRDLASLGVTLVADDYDGELSPELRHLPLRAAKLRLGLLDGIERDGGRRAQVATMVEEIRAAGWHCVGKGVETSAQAAILRELGCHGAQGFLFSGARPAEELDLFRTPAGVWAWSPAARSQPAV
jgi:EAL domain-containing protein (putative c-di-GMP-specific phosphodiesterase class I)/GGDEF domain-containing protein